MTLVSALPNSSRTTGWCNYIWGVWSI